jgi:hypothetical protein
MSKSLERPCSKERAATDSAKYKVHFVTEQCETQCAIEPAGNYTIHFGKGNANLSYLTGLFNTQNNDISIRTTYKSRGFFV